MTSSIEDAIRDNYNELKRSDSRRSSILAASVKSAGDHSSDGPPGLPQSASFGRQSSIVGLNTAARTGGYSPGGYIMSPTQSLTGRLRSGSKGSGPLSRANSTRSKPETIEGEAFPTLFASSMSRGGTGKGSVRSVRSIQSIQSSHSAQSNRSGPLSLAEIAEMEPPSALTLAAMDEADRTRPRLEDLGDDEATILSRARQHVEPNATDIEISASSTPDHESDRTPMLGPSTDSYWDNHGEPDLPLRSPHNPPSGRVKDEYVSPSEQRHEASGTPDTADEDDMFADFDGMHCDPDSVAEQFPFHPEETESIVPQSSDPPARQLITARPSSYFDPESGQQMLYYPARVPAMLNLPPKLGKGLKAAQQQRMARRSEVLSQMPKAAKESRIWLPDPLENQGPINLMGDDRPASPHHSTSRGQGPDFALAALEGHGTTSPLGSPSEPAEFQHLRRPPRLGDSDVRKSRMDLSGLPPQLRASAFFDMPSEIPKIVIKDGSATATLDSILDAAASAPVNAFTDHAYAGHLGAEVYGLEKKKNRKSQLNLVAEEEKTKPNRLTKSRSMLNVNEVEKRKSVWSLLPGRSKSKLNLVEVQEEDARSKISGSGHNENDSASDADEHSALAPDEAEAASDSDDSLLYDGPPTTLLAELQMRKRQHKKRTQNPLHHGDGLHSTLLERDAVAQMEARMRQKKKVNLAWATNATGPESDDDEDIPLGLLAAKKQIGPNATDRDLAIAVQELNRPLGLMEKRELEENEPLSRRRNRLQGKPVAIGMYLQPSGNATRLSVMPGNSSGSVSPRFLRSASPSSPAVASTPSPKPIEEVEGETLGERMKRLRAKEEGNNPLPKARPISRAFSEELLGELGLDKKPEDKGKGKAVDESDGKGKENAVPVVEEEEETLGQRRRRLQAEREAREKEMGTRGVSGGSEKEALTRRLGMADVLGANPVQGAQGVMDPREAERRRKEEEAVRASREQEVKMRLFRAQVPKEVSDPNGGVVKPGGYQGGRFNDSMGGLAVPTAQPMAHKQQVRASISMGQLNQFNQAPQGWTGPAYGGMNLIGAAGNYGNPNVGPDGLNPVFAKPNPFGNGYNGGFMQQMQNQQQGPFANGSLLAAGGYGAFGGGIGAAGGYPTNQTAYGAGVGFAGGMHPAYGMQVSGMPMVGGQGHAERVERWRQSIR